MPKTLGGKSTFQATSAHFVLCVYRRRVPSRRLANRPVRGALFLFYYIHCVSRPLAVQNTLQRRSLNDFFLEEQLCQLFERIPTEDQKLRTFWCASVNNRLISSSTMRAVSSLYSL